MASTVGERIREAREKAGKTQAELCEEAELNQPTLWRYEHDKILPGIDALAKIARALGVRMEWLTTGDRPVSERRAAAGGGG